MSLESPQLEDGFTPVANTIMDPICRTRLSGTDWDFLHFLWRKTYGWSKPSDIIALSQFCEGTGMSQSHVCRTIKRLLAMNVIFRHVARTGHGETATYEFNKRVWSWKSLPKLATLPALAIQPLPALAHTTSIKDTTSKRLSPIIPKVGKRKKVELTTEESEVLAYLNLKADNSFTAPGEIGKRLAEGHTVEECKIIIDKKVGEWGKTEFAKNLNPTTLFRLCHFDTYLHQKSEVSMKKFSVGEIGKSNMGEEWA
jgi:phage replication O-like protein O